jgi:hypothetical protein
MTVCVENWERKRVLGKLKWDPLKRQESGQLSRYSDVLGGQGSIPGRGRKMFSSSQSPKCPGPHPASYPMGTGTLSPGVNRPGSKADHSSPSSSKVKNDGATPPLPICFHGFEFN